MTAVFMGIHRKYGHSKHTSIHTSITHSSRRADTPQVPLQLEAKRDRT